MINLEDNVYGDTQKKQLIYLSHVLRMNEEKLPKIVLNFKTTKKKEKRKTQKSWVGVG